MINYWKYNLKIVHIQLTTSVNWGVRGLGKYLPVISSKKKYGKVRSVPKSHNGSPNLFLSKAGTLVLSPRTENDLLVVKDHGRADFVDSSRTRGRRKHRSLWTKSISTNFFLLNKGKMKWRWRRIWSYWTWFCIFKSDVYTKKIM